MDSSARPEVRGEDCPEVIVISDDEDSINYATPDLVDDSGHASEDSDRLEDEHEGPLMVRVSVPGLEASAAIAAMVEGELNADPQAEESTGVIQIEGEEEYRKTSSISRTKSPNLNVSCLALQLSLPNPLKPGIKLRMKM